MAGPTRLGVTAMLKWMLQIAACNYKYMPKNPGDYVYQWQGNKIDNPLINVYP